MALDVDTTIGLGTFVQLAVTIGGGFGVLAVLRNNVSELKAMAEKVQSKIDELQTLFIKHAEMNGRLDLLDQRIKATEDDYRDLRQGRGLIVEKIRGHQ